jgi:hypothetical protein
MTGWRPERRLVAQHRRHAALDRGASFWFGFVGNCLRLK